MFTKIDKKNLSDEISRQMISKILKGLLLPGDKLPPEREMAEQMNVNRHTLREALRKMELLGLLSVRQGDGIYVLDYRDSGNLELLKHILYTRKENTASIVNDILRIRSLVIPEMAASAAGKMTGEDIAMLQDLYRNKEKSIIEKDMAIHSFIARVSGNLLFMLLLNFFNDIFRQYAHLYFSFEENRNMTQKFHKNITDALSLRDSKKAKNIMSEVLIYAEQRISVFMEKANEKK